MYIKRIFLSAFLLIIVSCCIVGVVNANPTIQSETGAKFGTFNSSTSECDQPIYVYTYREPRRCPPCDRMKSQPDFYKLAENKNRPIIVCYIEDIIAGKADAKCVNSGGVPNIGGQVYDDPVSELKARVNKCTSAQCFCDDNNKDAAPQCKGDVSWDEPQGKGKCDAGGKCDPDLCKKAKSYCMCSPTGGASCLLGKELADKNFSLDHLTPCTAGSCSEYADENCGTNNSVCYPAYKACYSKGALKGIGINVGGLDKCEDPLKCKCGKDKTTTDPCLKDNGGCGDFKCSSVNEAGCYSAPTCSKECKDSSKTSCLKEDEFGLFEDSYVCCQACSADGKSGCCASGNTCGKACCSGKEGCINNKCQVCNKDNPCGNNNGGCAAEFNCEPDYLAGSDKQCFEKSLNCKCKPENKCGTSECCSAGKSCINNQCQECKTVNPCSINNGGCGSTSDFKCTPNYLKGSDNKCFDGSVACKRDCKTSLSCPIAGNDVQCCKPGQGCAPNNGGCSDDYCPSTDQAKCPSKNQTDPALCCAKNLECKNYPNGKPYCEAPPSSPIPLPECKDPKKSYLCLKGDLSSYACCDPISQVCGEDAKGKMVCNPAPVVSPSQPGEDCKNVAVFGSNGAITSCKCGWKLETCSVGINNKCCTCTGSGAVKPDGSCGARVNPSPAK